MNILFLVPYTPTPVRTRPHNLIRALSRRGHAVTLATVWETERERQSLAGWASQGVEVLAAPLPRSRSLTNMLLALPTGLPLQAAYCWQPRLARMVQSWLASRAAPPDVIHVEHLRGARYGLWLQANAVRAQAPVPVVWDSVDCISWLFEQAARSSRSRLGRWMTQSELGRTRRHESYLAGQFDRVLVASADDKQAFEQLAAARGQARRPAREISVVPNGVDVDYFTPNLADRSDNTVVVTGKMSYHANVTAALHLVEEVMPLVWARRPDVRVEVVGQSPPREVRALAGRYSPQVSVTGYVPDIRPYLWSAALAAAPVVYGAGIQNKVLEAMACATPVVATPQAVSALQPQPDQEVRVAGDAAGMAEHILGLLADESLRRRQGRAGWEYVNRYHRWAAVVEGLEGIYRELVGRIA